MSIKDPHWLSFHVFLADPAHTERYLQERLAPAIEAWRRDGSIDGWFFIRYWEGGPHLRIRLRGAITRQEDAVAGVLSADIETYLSERAPTREDYYRGHSFDGRHVEVADLPWYDEGSVVRIDYVPEYQRYGGHGAMSASEELFQHSSRLALGVCKATQSSWPTRLSCAFGLMATALIASGERMDGLSAYFADYGAFWATLSKRDSADQDISPPSTEQVRLLRHLEAQAAADWTERTLHAAWASGVGRLVAHLRTLHASGRLIAPHDGRPTSTDAEFRRASLGIVGSHIHMLNNRMGVPPAGELFLSGGLMRAADALLREGAAA